MSEVKAQILSMGKEERTGQEVFRILGVDGMFYADDEGYLYPRPHPGHCDTCTCSTSHEAQRSYIEMQERISAGQHG